MDPLYLDNAATTPIAPEVRAAMDPWLTEAFGNPSSRHPLGVRAAEALDRARRQVARAVDGPPAGVTFTSGGTEANNLAVLGFARARARHGRHVVIGPTEHSSVRDSAAALAEEGFEVECAATSPRGVLDLEDLARRLRPDTVLVAQMLVSNELGTRHPVRAAVRAVRSASPHAAVHVDAVQGLGKVELSLEDLGADTLSISAHKIHGPKGTGALVRREGVAPPRPLVFGGGQEDGLRSGTENVAGIVGLGAAAERADAHLPESRGAMAAARRALLAELVSVPGARTVVPDDAESSPAICALLLPGPPAEVWMHHLEAQGVLTSVGSACQAHKKTLSPALLALGLDEDQARRVLRVSFCGSTTVDEAREAGRRLREVARSLEARVG